MPIRTLMRPAVIIGQPRRTQRALAGQRRAAGVDRMIGIGRGRTPERHHRVADELVDRAAVAADFARNGIQIARQQRDDLIAEPLG